MKNKIDLLKIAFEPTTGLRAGTAFNPAHGIGLKSFNPLVISDDLSTRIQECRNINVSVATSNVLAGACVGAAVGLAADWYLNEGEKPNIGYPVVGATVTALIMGLLRRL